jgi:hypothetical protein
MRFRCWVGLLGSVVAIAFPEVAAAQSPRLGRCGDVTSFTDGMWDFLVTPMFVDTSAAEARQRSDFGLSQQPAGTTAHTVTDEKRCRDLERVLRETLRRSRSTPLRLKDVVPTYIQVGRYYFVSLSTKIPIPPGTEVKLPAVIIDGTTMTSVRLIYW